MESNMTERRSVWDSTAPISCLTLIFHLSHLTSKSGQPKRGVFYADGHQGSGHRICWIWFWIQHGRERVSQHRTENSWSGARFPSFYQSGFSISGNPRRAAICGPQSDDAGQCPRGDYTASFRRGNSFAGSTLGSFSPWNELRRSRGPLEWATFSLPRERFCSENGDGGALREEVRRRPRSDNSGLGSDVPGARTVL